MIQSGDKSSRFGISLKNALVKAEETAKNCGANAKFLSVPTIRKSGLHTFSSIDVRTRTHTPTAGARDHCEGGRGAQASLARARRSPRRRPARRSWCVSVPVFCVSVSEGSIATEIRLPFTQNVKQGLALDSFLIFITLAKVHAAVCSPTCTPVPTLPVHQYSYPHSLTLPSHRRRC